MLKYTIKKKCFDENIFIYIAQSNDKFSIFRGLSVTSA